MGGVDDHGCNGWHGSMEGMGGMDDHGSSTTLWNEAQFDPAYPAPILDFFADDIVHEDLVYKEPFVGNLAVIEFLQKTKDTD